MIRSPIIIGPTAGGKTELAVAVAHRLAEQHNTPAEVVSADSVQIYRGLDIGSAKPTPEEQADIPHHLIDIVDPDEPFTVHDWLARAEACLADIRRRGRVPIVVGGTHLYIKALLDGLFEGPEPDAERRAALMHEPLDRLRTRLEQVDPAAAARIHPNDRRRTVRALEVFDATGTPISQLQQQWDRDRPPRDDLRVFALRWAPEDINRRINARVRAMFDAGLVDEVRRLADRLGPQARASLGYQQVLAALARGEPPAQAAERIKIETRRFAKNQRTWLRRLASDPRFRWIDPPEPGANKAAQVVVDVCVG